MAGLQVPPKWMGVGWVKGFGLGGGGGGVRCWGRGEKDSTRNVKWRAFLFAFVGRGGTIQTDEGEEPSPQAGFF